jgi:hypothetical protein
MVNIFYSATFIGNKSFSHRIKLSQAASHVWWLKADETNVSRTISVLVLRELK